MALFRFDLPATKDVKNFAKVFAALDEDSAATVDRYKTLRDELVVGLGSDSTEAALNAIEAFLPQAHGMTEAVSNLSPADREHMPQLAYSWYPTTEAEKTHQWYVGKTPLFDLGMLTVAYGILLRARACDYCNSMAAGIDHESYYKNAATALKAAAGVFEVVRDHVVPSIVEEMEVTPIEFRIPVLNCLISTSLAEAQECTVHVGRAKKMSGGVLAKLALDARNRYRQSREALDEYAEFISPALLQYFDIKTGYMEAIAFMSAGVAKFDADEYGMGASFCQAALGAYGIVVDSIPAVAGQTGTGTWLEWFGVASSANDDQEMQNFVAKLTDFYTTLQEECGSRIRDNDTVYYAPLVPYDELEIPVAKSLVKVTAYELPEPAFASVALKEQSGCSLM